MIDFVLLVASLLTVVVLTVLAAPRIRASRRSEEVQPDRETIDSTVKQLLQHAKLREAAAIGYEGSDRLVLRAEARAAWRHARKLRRLAARIDRTGRLP